MNNNETNASLIVCLVEKAVHFCKIPAVSLTHKYVLAAHLSAARIRTTQKETGILMDDTMLHTVSLGDLTLVVHSYVNDTYALVMVLRRVPELSAECVIMMDTGAM